MIFAPRLRALMSSAVKCASLEAGLAASDATVSSLIARESARQLQTVNMIPSENYSSASVHQAVGSIMNSKYSEGLPLNRYYGGNKFIDQMEILCQNRALSLFNLDSAEWGINVQSHSLTPANFHVLTGLLGNHDRLMSLAFEDGGHISHGQFDGRKKLAASSIFFEVLNYRVNQTTGEIDYDQLEAQARSYMPKVIIGGADLHCRNIDYQRLRKIADAVDAYLIVDLNQTAGLVATSHLPNPFTYADIVTAPSHKSLRGPRGALVFYRQAGKKGAELKGKIENAIFPGSQGGPHNHTISGIAVALKEAKTAEYTSYSADVLANAKALENELTKSLSTGVSKTNNHLVLVNLKEHGVSAGQLVNVLHAVNLDAFVQNFPQTKTPAGFIGQHIALGSHAMTTRGCGQKDFHTIGEFLTRAVKEVKGTKPAANAEELKQLVGSNGQLLKLKTEVEQFAKNFAI